MALHVSPVWVRSACLSGDVPLPVSLDQQNISEIN